MVEFLPVHVIFRVVIYFFSTSARQATWLYAFSSEILCLYHTGFVLPPPPPTPHPFCCKGPTFRYKHFFLRHIGGAADGGGFLNVDTLM